MGLLGGVFDDGQPVGQRSGQEDVHGGAHRHHIQIDLRTVEPAGGGGGMDKAVLHLNSGSHGGEALQVLVNGPHPQVTPAGWGHFRPAEAAQQGPDQIVGSTNLAGQFVGNILLMDMGTVQLHGGGVDHPHLGAQVPKDPQDHGDIADIGDVLNPADTVYQKGCGKNSHSGILCTADLHFTVEGMSTPDYIFRQNGTFFIWFLEEVESKWRNRESGKRRFGPLSILSKRPGQHVPAWTERQKNSSPPLLAGNDAAGPWGSQRLSRCIAAPKGVLLARTFPGGGRTTTYTFEAIIASLSPNEKVNFHKTGVFLPQFHLSP